MISIKNIIENFINNERCNEIFRLKSMLKSGPVTVYYKKKRYVVSSTDSILGSYVLLNDNGKDRVINICSKDISF